MRELRDGINSCVGANSYIVFLFRQRGLFRISWRLPEDAGCPSTRAAAEDIFGRYLAIDRSAALATHYRAGKRGSRGDHRSERRLPVALPVDEPAAALTA